MLPSPGELFWAKVRVGEPDECWPWIGCLGRRGYGDLTVLGEKRKAHRLSWEFANGPLPAGAWVLHRCDNPPCVNPDHLFAGDSATNVHDMHAKGRHRNGKERQRACKRGHEFTGANTYFWRGHRICRTCVRMRVHDWRVANLELARERVRLSRRRCAAKRGR
jgi:hypothetical protein